MVRPLKFLFWGMVFWGCASPSYLFGQQFNPRNYLEGTVVYDVTRGADGVMWFGTDSGLYSYDGRRFRHFTNIDGLPGSEIFTLKPDQFGRIWMSGFSGIPAFIEDGRIYGPDQNPALAEASLTTPHSELIITPESVWYAGDRGDLVEISLLDFSVSHHRIRDAVYFTRFMFKPDPSNLVVGLSELLFWVDLETWNYTEIDPGLEFTSSRKIRLSHGDYTPTIDHKLFRFDPTGGIQLIDLSAYQLSGTMLSGTVLPDERTLLVGTTSGLYRLDLEKSRPAVQINDNFTTNVFLDPEGNIWTSTHGNGVWFYPSIFWNVDYFTAESIGLNRIFSAAIYDEDTIFTGGGQSALARITPSNREIHHHHFDTEFAFNNIEYIRKIDDRLFIGHASMLYISPEKDFSGFTSIPVFATKDICACLSQTGEYYLASSHGITKIKASEGVIESDIIFGNRSSAVHKTPDGFIYFGTPQGLNRITPDGDIEEVDFGASAVQVTGLVRLDHNRLIVTTNGSGLWMYNLETGASDPFAGNDFSQARVVRKAKPAEDGRIWIATDSGAGLFDPAAPDQYRHLFAGNFVDLDYADGAVVLASTNRILLYRTQSEIHQPEITLPLQPVSVFVDEQLSGKDALSRLHHSTRSIRFELNAPFYRNPGSVRYQYRLSGAPDNWQFISGSSLEFLEMRPGNYNVELRAVTADFANISEIQSVQFSVYPALWQRGPVRLTGLLLLVMFIGVLGFLRVRTVKKREQEKLSQYSRMIELERRALDAMMNPHFVFYVLNAIRQHMQNQETGKAEYFLERFSRLIRLQLESSNKSRIPLDEELNRIRILVELEAARLKIPIELNVTFDDEAADPEDLFIPPMVLQPLIENSIKHGFRGSTRPGRINLAFSIPEEDVLRGVITDNGKGLIQFTKKTEAPAQAHISMALEIIRERLEILSKMTGKRAGITITPATGEGTIVELYIPLQ